MAILRPTRLTSSRKSEGTGLTPEAVMELRRATDLALRATKHTARAVGRLMAGSVAEERHLWLNLRGEPFHRYGARSDRKAFLPASNVLSSLKTVTATPRGLACGTSSSSFILGLAVGGRVVFPPLQSVLSPPAGRVCGDTVDYPLQRSDLQGFHRYGARSDRKSISARFKRALLTQNRHSHP